MWNEQTDNWNYHKWPDKSIWCGTETYQMRPGTARQDAYNMNAMIDPFSAVIKQTKWLKTDKQNETIWMTI